MRERQVLHQNSRLQVRISGAINVKIFSNVSFENILTFTAPEIRTCSHQCYVFFM